MAESKKKGFVIRKERLLSLICGIVTFVILFVPWVKMDEGNAFTLYAKDLDVISDVLNFTKIMAIITMVVSILYIICQLIDVEKVIPGLKKFKFGFYRLFGLIYYGLLEFVCLFAIIGAFSCDYTDPTVRVFILFLIFAAGIVRFAIPKVYNAVAKAVNITIE